MFKSSNQTECNSRLNRISLESKKKPQTQTRFKTFEFSSCMIGTLARSSSVAKIDFQPIKAALPIDVSAAARTQMNPGVKFRVGAPSATCAITSVLNYRVR